jgi:sporulation protein YlmC with PRC-barrel domain
VLDSAEERFMQPRIGSEIYATDGQVGRVQQVVINPQNRRVTAVMLQVQVVAPQQLDWTETPAARPPAPHPVLISLSRIRCAPSGALFLNVNSDQVSHATDFNPAAYTAPPVDWQPPYPYQRAEVLFSKEQSEEERL